MQNETYHIVVPVKDSQETAERALRALKGQPVVVWNDNSTTENTARLHTIADELGFECIDVASLTDHPSPNYLLLLQTMQQRALAGGEHVILVESDVLVAPDTKARLLKAAHQPQIGMVAAVTTDEDGKVNFPYEYARHLPQGTITTTKLLSFCCTLLTVELLQRVDFAQLDPSKNWYDVTISKCSRKCGLTNILLTDTPVRHFPHSSRPWKRLKYTHPLRYYWQKIFYGRDKI